MLVALSIAAMGKDNDELRNNVRFFVKNKHLRITFFILKAKAIYVILLCKILSLKDLVLTQMILPI